MEMESASAAQVCSNEDLLSKILAGLPVSSLRLCKSVCKRWFSLITDPYFIRTRSPRPCGLLLQLEHECSLFAYLPLKPSSSPPLPSITTLTFPFNPTRSAYIEPLQTCNGLLLCYDSPAKYYVYNPTINHCKLLPRPRNWKPPAVIYRSMALAFDPSLSPHYKLVCPTVDDAFTTAHVQIYSSETGNWGACARTYSPSYFHTFGRQVVYWRGAIHWFSSLCVYHFSLDDIRNPHFIQLNNKSLSGFTFCICDKLFVSRGSLLLAKMLPHPLQMDLYEMNDYSSGWSIKYHVNLDATTGPGGFPGPDLYVISVVLGETEEDSFIVFDVTETEVTQTALIQYNLFSKTFHQLLDLKTQIQIRPLVYSRFPFIPSLVGV